MASKAAETGFREQQPPPDEKRNSRLTDGRAAKALACYLSNYDKRLFNSEAGRIFPNAEANALAALLHGRTAALTRSRTAQAGAFEVARRLVFASAPGADGLERDMLGYAATALLDAPFPQAVDGVSGLLHKLTGDAPPETGSVYQTLWRAAFLAGADTGKADGPAPDAGRRRGVFSAVAQALAPQAGGEDELSLRVRKLRKLRTTAHKDPVENAHWAYILTIINRNLHDDALAEAARAIAAHDKVDRWIERQIAGADEPAPTKVAARVILAKLATGLEEQGLQLAEHLFETRHDDKSGVLRAGPDPSAKLEFYPWVPLALAEIAGPHDAVDDVFDPPAPAPETFRLQAPRAEPEAVRFTVDWGRRRDCAVTAQDLNLVLARILAQFETSYLAARSARFYADAVLGLYEVLDRAGDDETRFAVQAQIDRCLEYVLDSQAENGGWAFGRQNVASTVFSRDGAKASVFPDLQYSIDVAVPGLALCAAYRRTGDARFLEAVERGLAFIEKDIGRITWNGKTVWRLYPEDEKTAKTGTAVNYELWVGHFFASLAAVARDPSMRDRLLGYVDDIITYTEGHIFDDGDIAYGDYVRERRTAYASWDAYLLAAIGRDVDKPRATKASEIILARLADLLLDSGAMPNVSDYEENVWGEPRWSVHRHGVGPYPVTAYYQFFFVVAAMTAGVQSEAALRAFGFVMLRLYEPVFGSLAPGWGGDGSYTATPGALSASNWFPLAAAQLDRICDFEYRPSIKNIAPPSARFRQAAEDLAAAIESKDPAAVSAPENRSRFGAAALRFAETTGSERWRKRAETAAAALASANETGTSALRFLLQGPEGHKPDAGALAVDALAAEEDGAAENGDGPSAATLERRIVAALAGRDAARGATPAADLAATVDAENRRLSRHEDDGFSIDPELGLRLLHLSDLARLHRLSDEEARPLVELCRSVYAGLFDDSIMLKYGVCGENEEVSALMIELAAAFTEVGVARNASDLVSNGRYTARAGLACGRTVTGDFVDPASVSPRAQGVSARILEAMSRIDAARPSWLADPALTVI